MSEKEIQKKIFELTLALYRVTDFFPQGEALRRHLREKAGEIFGGISEYRYAGDDAERLLTLLLGRIESIAGFLNIAKAFRFVNPINFTVLEKEYAEISEIIKNELDIRKDTARASLFEEGLAGKMAGDGVTWGEFALQEAADGATNLVSQGKEPSHQKVVKEAKKDQGAVSDGMNDRQKRIMEHLKEVNRAKISDFYSFFSEISSKTIQRDLQDLVSKNLLKKDGEKRWTVYTVNVR